MSPTALDLRIKQVDNETLFVAKAGLHLVEQFVKLQTPEALDEAQDFIRAGLQDTEARMRVLRDRVPRRSGHFSARARRKPQLGPRIPAHLEALKHREALYSERREMLRELGDALLWDALKTDINRIAPLYKEGTHELPDEMGLVGVLQVIELAHESGHFFAIENDLTRCAGVGDITAVRVDCPEALPLVMEIKTHVPEGELREGGEMQVMALMASSSRPVDQETEKMFADAVRLDDEPGSMQVSRRGERQGQTIVDRVEVIGNLLAAPSQRIRPGTRYWDLLANLLRRARVSGHAWDAAEKGQYYFATRMRLPRAELLKTLRSIRDGIQRISGIPASQAHVAHSGDLLRQASLSSRVPPVALWPLPFNWRAELLAGRFGLGVVMDPQLFSDLFRQAGVEFEERSDGSWEFSTAEGVVTMGRLKVEAIKLGTLFSGLSPGSVVDSIAEGLDGSRSRL